MKQFLFLMLFLSYNLFAQKSANVLVRPLVNAGDNSYYWFADGFYNSLIYNLGIVKNINMQSIEEMNSAYNIQENVNQKPDKKILSKLSLDLIIYGSYTIKEKSISITIKLKSRGESKKTATFTTNGTLDSLEVLEKELIQSIFEECKEILPGDVKTPDLTDIELHKISLNKLPLKSFQSYSKGLNLQNKNPGEAMKYFLAAAKESSEFPGIYLAIGEHLSLRQNLPDNSLQYLNKALNILKERKEEDTHNYLKVLSQLALAYYKIGDRKNAFAHYILTKQAFQKQNTSGVALAFVLNKLGTLYLDADNQDNAIDCFLVAKKIYENLDLYDSYYYAELQSSIGMFYFDSEKQNAILHLEDAKQSFEDNKYTNNTEYADCLTYIGNYHLLESKYNTAIDRYSKALEIYQKIGFTRSFFFASLLNNMGIIYLHKGDLNQAKSYFEKSKNLLENLKLEESWTYSSALVNLTQTYYLLKEKDHYKKNLRLEWKMQKRLINEQTKYVEE